MLERTIENYLVKQVKAAGGEAEKFTSPGKRHVPDRIVSWPFGFKDWVETKAPGKKPRAGQVRDHQKRLALNHVVWVIDTKKKVDEYVNHCLRRHDKMRRRTLHTSAGADYGRHNLMVLAAFRYCLGRRSYIVSDCVEWLIRIWPMLDFQSRELIRKELEEEFTKDDDSRLAEPTSSWHPLGMNPDRRKWEEMLGLWKK